MRLNRNDKFKIVDVSNFETILRPRRGTACTR